VGGVEGAAVSRLHIHAAAQAALECALAYRLLPYGEIGRGGQMVRKTVISQLQSVGEGALEKLAASPATRTALQGAVQVKEKGERFLHALESIDERLESIERRLSAIEKAKPKRATPASRSTAAATHVSADDTPAAS